MAIHYTPANGTEGELFMGNCRDCIYYNANMLRTRHTKITCPILYKIIWQMCYSEKVMPQYYEFNDGELDTSVAPARCLKKETREV